MLLIDIVYKIPGPFDIIINNLSLIDLNNIIKTCKTIYNIKLYIIKYNSFYKTYKKINNTTLYNHLIDNDLFINFMKNFNNNKKLNLILYKYNAISIEFYPKNVYKLTDCIINDNIDFIYNSKINDINGFKHFKYTNCINYIEYIIENRFLYIKNNIISEVFYKNFKHIDIIFNKAYIIVYYSYIILYHNFYYNYKCIKHFYLTFSKSFKKINFNINYYNAIYILQVFKNKIDNICELLLKKIGSEFVLFYKIHLLYIYMVVEKNFGKKYDLIINYNDIDNNKKLLIEKIKVLKIPKYLKNIMSNKIKVI